MYKVTTPQVKVHDNQCLTNAEATSSVDADADVQRHLKHDSRQEVCYMRTIQQLDSGRRNVQNSHDMAD